MHPQLCAEGNDIQERIKRCINAVVEELAVDQIVVQSLINIFAYRQDEEFFVISISLKFPLFTFQI